MYYNKRKMVVSIFWLIIGITLLFLEFTGMSDNSIYSGMGGGLLGVGIMQIARNIKYNSNQTYKEKVDIEYNDERNKYIRMKAWSWAGYLFILGSAIVSLVLFIVKMTLYGKIVSYCMCAVLVIYWISYMVLLKKY